MHTADLHLGAKIAKLGSKAEEQRIQIQKTFESLVQLAIDSQVDLFLIAGDIFDMKNPEKGLIDFFVANLVRLNDRHIFVIVTFGTHDFIEESSVYKTMDIFDLPYIKVFNDPAIHSFEIPELDAIIFSNVALTNKTSETPLINIKRDERYRFNIAIAHGSVQIPGKSSQNDSPITFTQIEETQMDYVALGHWHNQQELSKGKVICWYAGPPEMVNLDEKNSGKILMVYIEDAHAVEVESITVGKRFSDELILDVSSMNTFEELLQEMRVNANPDLVRKVILKGIVSSDFGNISTDEIEMRIGQEFFYLSIKDKTESAVIDIEREIEGNLLKSKFIVKINEMGLEESVKNDALQMGLSLLRGSKKIT